MYGHAYIILHFNNYGFQNVYSHFFSFIFNLGTLTDLYGMSQIKTWTIPIKILRAERV